MTTVTISIDGGPAQTFTMDGKGSKPTATSTQGTNMGVLATFNAKTTKESRAYNQFESPTVGPGGSFLIALDITDQDSTKGRDYAALTFGDFGSERAFKTVSVTNDPESTGYVFATDQNAGGGVFNINDAERTGFNLTTGRWYFRFQNRSTDTGATVAVFAVPETPA